MGAITVTEVTTAKEVYSGGMEKRLYTCATGGAGNTIDLSGTFENIYYCRAWDRDDGTDAKAYVADADYAADDLTIGVDKGNIYVEVIGLSVKSTGGST